MKSTKTIIRKEEAITQLKMGTRLISKLLNTFQLLGMKGPFATPYFQMDTCPLQAQRNKGIHRSMLINKPMWFV